MEIAGAGIHEQWVAGRVAVHARVAGLVDDRLAHVRGWHPCDVAESVTRPEDSVDDLDVQHAAGRFHPNGSARWAAAVDRVVDDREAVDRITCGAELIIEDVNSRSV